MSDHGAVMDSFDVDLVVKVLAHTLFSPFFIFMVPTFYFFQGNPLNHPAIVYSAAYGVALCLFWGLKWLSELWRNQGSLFFGPGRFQWGDQIVVVTGGSSGIGELLANTLAVRNVPVVVLDKERIISENHNIIYYKCDVSKWEEVEAVAKKISEEIGDPTVLVNNAGVVQGKLVLDLTPKQIQETFNVNTLAHFWTLKAFLPAMIKNNAGHIITVSSIMGIASSAQMTDYCASKAALVSLHESLRYELDKRYLAPRVRTTLVMPGHTHTRMFSTAKLPGSSLFKFFAPSLPPVTVVKAIIAALDNQHSTTIWLPFYTNFVGIVRVMPSYVRDAFQWISGADYAMAEFEKGEKKQ
jgi:short-subunit dehydrogenase